MTSLSKLPYHIKENIFSRIRIRDLYEVAVVTEEWWWLTLKSYKGILREEDQLIKSLLNVFNREKKLSTPLVWFQLVKYADLSDVELDYCASSMVLSNFLKSRKPIRSLCLRTESGSSYQANHSFGIIEIPLGSVLKYFPHLKELKVKGSSKISSALKIAKGITHVHLSKLKVYGVAWSSLFEEPESIQSLELPVYRGLTFDLCTFKNLRSLSLYFEEPLADHLMKNILDSIRGQKHLKSIKLVNTKITKDWLHLFDKNIQNITLVDIFIEKQLLPGWGVNGCYERWLMSFLCCNLTTVELFYLSYMSMEAERFGENEEDLDVACNGFYTCRPKLMKENLFLELVHPFSRQLQTIITTEEGPALRDLFIICVDVKEKLTNCVPASVKKLDFRLDGKLENLSIGQLCEQPENLEELNLYSLGVTTSLSVQRDCFALCTQLKILGIIHLNRDGLRNVLQQCVLLEKLTLTYPERGCFSGLSPTIVSKTIREVNLNESDAHLEDLLYHCPNLEVLHLSSHLKNVSMPTAVANLKLFTAAFRGSRDIPDKSKSFALVIDTLEVPFKLFYLNKWRCKFTLAKSDSFIKEFHENDGYAYCRGFPTRFLEARGIRILDDVQQFTKEIASNTDLLY